MNGLLEFILLHHFGYIFLGLCLLIAAFVIKNKLAQLITFLKPQSTGNPTEANLPILNLETAPKQEPSEKTTLNEKEFEETFGLPMSILETPTKQEEEFEQRFQAPTFTPTSEIPPPTKESIIELVKKTARGDKK